MDVLRERKSDCPNINMYKHCRGLSLVCEYAIWNMMYSSLVGILVKWPHDCCGTLATVGFAYYQTKARKRSRLSLPELFLAHC